MTDPAELPAGRLPDALNRRDVLRYTAWLTGAAVSAPLASAILSGCSESPREATEVAQATLHYFSPEQFQRLTQVVDALLPRTDSPSASDVGVPSTMDAMLGLVFPEVHLARFGPQWQALQHYLDSVNFAGLNLRQQAEALVALELSDDEALAGARSGLLEIKQQAVAYYLTTEVVARNHLNYLPIPGTYRPCISVDDVNNTAWAIHR